MVTQFCLGMQASIPTFFQDSACAAETSEKGE